MNTFAETELIAPVQRALADEGYARPTPIQAKTMEPALRGRDVLGCAQTGTGKTAAFALPILHELGKRNSKAMSNRPVALVLAPTRELAVQIGDSFAAYGRHLRLRTALVYGGVSQLKQVRALNRGAHIVVATPGRLLDLMNQGYIKLDRLKIFVLDEADRMLDMGFLPDLKKIINRLPAKRQSMFFSATMPSKITDLSNRLLSDPVKINVTPKSVSVEKIKQQVKFVERGAKLKLLKQVLSDSNIERALIFTKTKRTANSLSEKLIRSGMNATAIHGNKSQGARQRALAAFRSNKVRILVATDVAARGIDVEGISHVVNYDLPIEPESYVHRIGRTGRAGADGIALTFCTANEKRELRAIEKLIGKRIPMDKAATPEKDFVASDSNDSTSRSKKRNKKSTKNRASRHKQSKKVKPRANSTRKGIGSSTVRNKKRSNKRRKVGTDSWDTKLEAVGEQKQPTA